MKPIRSYAAFLRGVSPMNARMSDVKRCFEAAGFAGVKTVLSSGNVVFSAPSASGMSVARKAEKAMQEGLDRTFLTIVRSMDALRELLDADPYASVRLPHGSKRVVTFLREPPERKPRLPIEFDGARILSMKGGEVFSAYVPSPRGPVFMRFIEETFGNHVTTRTWETIQKVVAAEARGR